jgi:glycosyltransferase involved in cell wall biosynthesis
VPDKQGRIKVMLILDSMGLGGAQVVVDDFYSTYDRQCFDVCVCVLGKKAQMIRNHDDDRVEPTVLGIAKWSPFCTRRLKEVADKFEPDIIYAHLFKSLVYGARLAKRLGLPLVYHEHNVSRDIAAGKFVARLLYRAKQHYAAQAKKIIACGARAADMLMLRGIGQLGQVHMVPNGIDLDRFKFTDEELVDTRQQVRDELGIPQDVTIICNVGRFNVQKNWPDFFKAAEQAIGDRQDVRLLAVGDGDLLPEMKAVAAGLGIAGHTIFTGFRTDVPRLLVASDLMLFTSGWEGGPLVVQEAMACGVSPISYDVGDTRRMIRNGLDGYVVDQGDVEGLVTYLKMLLDDPDQRRAFRESGRVWAIHEFDYRLMVRRIELVLASARRHPAQPFLVE